MRVNRNRCWWYQMINEAIQNILLNYWQEITWHVHWHCHVHVELYYWLNSWYQMFLYCSHDAQWINNMSSASPVNLIGLKAPGIQHGCWGLVWWAQLGSDFLKVLTWSSAANLLSSQRPSPSSPLTLLSIISIQKIWAHRAKATSRKEHQCTGRWVWLDERAEWKRTAQMTQESRVACALKSKWTKAFWRWNLYLYLNKE